MDIRTATTDDLPALLALYRKLHPTDSAVSLEDAADILDRYRCYAGSDIFLGIVEGTFVASCALVIIPNLTRGGLPYGLIENVVTDPDHRKRGYGKAMLQAATAAAWRHGCYKVMLLTGSTNPATIRFYGDAGFEQTKTGFQIRRPA
ncbi:MAG: GNAT family N-acetyltransferase [Pseudomonadota bacterium]